MLDRVFAELQRPALVRVRVEVMSLDSTRVKVHPDGTGALKQTVPKPSGSHAGAGAPGFIGLPRMIEAQSDSRSPGEKRVTGHKDVPCRSTRTCSRHGPIDHLAESLEWPRGAESASDARVPSPGARASRPQRATGPPHQADETPALPGDPITPTGPCLGRGYGRLGCVAPVGALRARGSRSQGAPSLPEPCLGWGRVERT